MAESARDTLRGTLQYKGAKLDFSLRRLGLTVVGARKSLGELDEKEKAYELRIEAEAVILECTECRNMPGWCKKHEALAEALYR